MKEAAVVELFPSSFRGADGRAGTRKVVASNDLALARKPGTALAASDFPPDIRYLGAFPPIRPHNPHI